MCLSDTLKGIDLDTAKPQMIHGKYDVPMSGLSCTTKLTPLASSPYSYINTRFPHVYIKNDVYPGNTITHFLE